MDGRPLAPDVPPPEEQQPHHSEYVPHTLLSERRVPVDYDPAGHDPGEEDPELSDTLDEALAEVLPGDDAPLLMDEPVADVGEDDPSLPLVDPAPGEGPDDEVGDADDEDAADRDDGVRRWPA